jgi:hypothetical protein
MKTYRCVPIQLKKDIAARYPCVGVQHAKVLRRNYILYLFSNHWTALGRRRGGGAILTAL